MTKPKVDKLVSALNKAVSLMLDVSKKIDLWDQPPISIFQPLGVYKVPSMILEGGDKTGGGGGAATTGSKSN